MILWSNVNNCSYCDIEGGVLATMLISFFSTFHKYIMSKTLMFPFKILYFIVKLSPILEPQLQLQMGPNLKGIISVFDIIYFRKAEKKLINMVAITHPSMSQCEKLLTLLQNIIHSFVSNLGLLQLFN